MASEQSPKKRIRILVADQEGVFRIGLKKLLGVEDDLRVVAQAQDTAQTVALTGEFKPELGFLQSELARQDPDVVFGQIRQRSPDSKIVITASGLSEDESDRYVKSGAVGVILKTDDPSLFVKCARQVMANEVWLPKKQIVRLVQGSQERVRPRDTLTSREKSIVSYLMQGWRNKEIAQHLSITEQTVKNHLRTVYDKLGVSDRLELVLYIIHTHLELPPTDPSVSSAAKEPRSPIEPPPQDARPS